MRKFSNRYAIGVNEPADDAHWTTFADAVVAAERHIYRSFANGGARIVEAIGYAHTSDVPVFSKVYASDGDLVATAMQSVPGDCAALVKYTTPDRSTKNHPVYCFNYYHGIGASDSGSVRDLLAAGQAAALLTYGQLWLAGISDGAGVFKRSRPTGDLCTGVVVNPNITHRDLAR